MKKKKITNTNCFAYSNGECSVLNEEKGAKCKDCRFFKTNIQVKKERKEAFKMAQEKGYYIDTKDYIPKN